MPGRPLQVRAAASQGQKAVSVGVDLGSFKKHGTALGASGPFRKLYCTKLVIRTRWLGSPPAGRARDAVMSAPSGGTCQSFFEVTMQYELVVAASKLTIFPRKIT